MDGEQGENPLADVMPPMTPSGSELEGEEDDDDEEERGSKSIGKSLWSFFTT